MSIVKDFFYSAADGIFAIGRKQRIIYWDQGCEELFGVSSNWVLGRLCCDVMHGCNPVSNKPFCSQDCCVAKLSNGVGPAPKSFKIKINKDNEKPIVVGVNIVLVPSECKNDWIVTHFLHREYSPGVLNSFEYAKSRRSCISQKALNTVSAASEQQQCCLTNRENEVLLLLAEGLTSSDISQRINISQTTARNHVQHILSKLSVHSKAEAVAYAYRHEII